MCLTRTIVWRIMDALIRAKSITVMLNINLIFEEYWMEPIISKTLSGDMDNKSRIDSMLNDLVSGRLSQRIAEVAALAAARHMYQEAQEMRSTVEAEYSTQ